MADFFKDVIAKDPRFNQVARVSDLALLEPTTRELVQHVIVGARSLGIDLIAYETYRSEARQQELFRQGATQLRKVGVHHYGLACDLVKSVSGEPSWKGDFSFLGQLARSAGLIWGGDWGDPSGRHSFYDAVHVQRCTVGRQSELMAGNWYPDDTYNPYQDDEHPLFAKVSAATAGNRRA